MELLAGIAVGAAVGIAGRLVAARLRAYRLLLFGFRRLRDRSGSEEAVVGELERDPYFGREYARPSNARSARAAVS